MTDLKSLFEGLGFRNVRTYIQSGNVIFESNEEKNLNYIVQQKISENYNFQVPVIIRSVHEMESVLNNNPFLRETDIDESKLHVTFLDTFPLKEHIKKTEALNFKPDRFVIKCFGSFYMFL